MATTTTRAHRSRLKPGAGGGGRFFHVEVRSPRNFIRFRVQALGSGGIERVAGQHAGGSWDTQKWLIRKDRAHIENGVLVADAADVRELLGSLASAARQVLGDRFKAAPRRDIPERAKPTAAMRRARLANIRKAQAARRSARGDA
jgi:hypothetical protein